MKITAKKNIDIFELFVHDSGLTAAYPFADNCLQEALQASIDKLVPEPERIEFLTPDDTGRDRWAMKYWPNQYMDKFKELGARRRYNAAAVRLATPKAALAYLDVLNAMDIVVV